MTEPLDYETLDPGIRRVVALLNHACFETTDFGDGVTKVGSMECAMAYPHVFMTVDPTALIHEALRLHRVLEGAGITPVPNGQGGVSIEASYDPADDSAVLMLTGLNDAMLKDGP